MARTSRLYNKLLKLLGQSDEWADLRHLQTVSWMVVRLICSGCVSLTKWTLYVESRAVFAQSHQRRFSRWLHNPRLNVQRLYSPLIQAASISWGVTVIPIIEDTTVLWNTYCLIQVSVQYRGRAVPIAWRVLEHKSSSVSFDEYKQLLKRVARLLPSGVAVRFLADRGFADTTLIRCVVEELDWNYRIRLKNDTWVYLSGKGWTQLRQFHLGLSEAVLLHGVTLTKTHHYGLVNLALGRDPTSQQHWYIVSNESTSLQTFP